MADHPGSHNPNKAKRRPTGSVRTGHGRSGNVRLKRAKSGSSGSDFTVIRETSSSSGAKSELAQNRLARKSAERARKKKKQ